MRAYFWKLCTAIAVSSMAAACADIPQSVEEIGWQDSWGDRGQQVFARDYAMCAELVEQRRSLMTSCLSGRGWSVGKQP
jgi:hypothetical protein